MGGPCEQGDLQMQAPALHMQVGPRVCACVKLRVVSVPADAQERGSGAQNFHKTGRGEEQIDR